jgi:hypothetical protein
MRDADTRERYDDLASGAGDTKRIDNCGLNGRPVPQIMIPPHGGKLDTPLLAIINS